MFKGEGGMSSKVMDKLKKRVEEAELRLAEREAIEAELEPIETTEYPVSNNKSTKGKTSQQIIESLEFNITHQEQLGLFDAFPLSRTNTCPTLLARSGIFPAMSAQSQKKYLDADNAWVFKSPFGEGRRFGSNLTVFDKCVLHALYRLREKRLRGEHGNLPIKVSKIFKPEDDGKIDVDIVICTIAQILDEFGKNLGGKNYRDILSSLKRIAACRIEMSVNKHDRYLGKCERGKIFQLIDIEWASYDTQGIVYIQFSPLVTQWLEHEFTYLDWGVHMSLGRNEAALALHEFLSSQKRDYAIDMLKLAGSIGVKGTNKTIKAKLQSGCTRLKEVGWLNDFQFIGTGRKVPYQLVTSR